MRRAALASGRLLSLALVLPLLTLGNCSSQDGFECGSPQRNNPDVIGRCSRNLEVCMCATSSCAVQDRGQFRGPAPEDGTDEPDPMPAAGGDGAGGAEPAPPTPAGSNICKSGYRYTDTPFANSTWANRCVPLVHLQTAIVGTQENPGPMCPTVPPTPAVGGSASGGASGSGGMSGTGGAGGEGGVGAGGVGGQGGASGGESPSPTGGVSGESAMGGNKSEGAAAGVPVAASGVGGR